MTPIYPGKLLNRQYDAHYRVRCGDWVIYRGQLCAVEKAHLTEDVIIREFSVDPPHLGKGIPVHRKNLSLLRSCLCPVTWEQLVIEMKLHLFSKIKPHLRQGTADINTLL